MVMKPRLAVLSVLTGFLAGSFLAPLFTSPSLDWPTLLLMLVFGALLSLTFYNLQPLYTRIRG